MVDPATGRDVGVDQVGELWVRIAQNGDWLQTGDLGRRDADGYIYPSGRLKDTINRGERSSARSRWKRRCVPIRRSVMSR